jgi:shikimate dehydrogenase
MKEVYGISDLASRALLDAGHDKPAALAVIGHPVAHSASPEMHQPALDACGIRARYIRVDIDPGRVREAFSRMRELGFTGCNVTVPHKFEALEACDEIHPDARLLGAVNTVRFDTDSTRGFNTDGPGFVSAIADDFATPLSCLKVVILGAGGGAGQAIAVQCAMQGVVKLTVVNRTAGKLASLGERLRAIGGSDITALSFDDPALQGACLDADLIVNTTSVGLKRGDPTVIPASCLRPGHFVCDCIYQPPVTPLLALADRIGCKTTNGLSLLVHQGVLAFQHWFPGRDPLEVMRQSLSASGKA